MMRVTPFRFTTLQCSQIGWTLVRTFTLSLQFVRTRNWGKTMKIDVLEAGCK
jgi:hypothetical protein